MKTAKKQFLASVVSLMLCVAMLVGTTFAWFTDSAGSTNNIIKSGNLDVELEYLAKDENTGEFEWTAVEDDTALIDNDAKWEPGHAEVVYLKASNLGELALKYQLGVNIVKEVEGTNVDGNTFKLSDYIYMGLAKDVDGKTAAFADRKAAIAEVSAEATLIEANSGKGGELYPVGNTDNYATEAYFALVIYMPETVGNVANYKKGTTPPELQLGVNIAATQLIYEGDDFGKDYDTDATYPSTGSANVPANSTSPTNIKSGDVTTTIPAGAPAGNYTSNVTNKNVETNAAGETVVSFDIELLRDGVKVVADGVTVYTLSIYVGENLNVTRVTHKGNPVSPFHYDPYTGVVTFETDSFSPFAVTMEKVSDSTIFVPKDEEAADKLENEADIVAVDEDGNTYATLKDAIASGASKLYFKEGVDLGSITHLDITNDLVIYGNGSYISGGEHDFAVDNDKNLEKDITVTVYNLHGVAFWGNRDTEYTVNLNLHNCNDLVKIYLTGTSGVNNIGLYNCTVDGETLNLLDVDTAVYSNANGIINVDGCTFTNVKCPINLNHKVAGEQTVNVTNSKFVDCATEGDAAYYAPIRLYNSVEGANQTLKVEGNTFDYSEGKAPINKADVLLNAKHNGADATGTVVATLQADATFSCGVNVTLTCTVDNADELFAVAKYVNSFSNYEYPYEGVTVLLTDDIDLGGAEWTPIGDYRFSANRFCGTFDGQGHSISDFQITKKTDKNDSNKSSYGFFGNVEGTVKNLTIENATVSSYAYVGALVGRLTGGTLENCHVKNSSVANSYWQGGGMVGQLNDGCTVIGCTVTNTTVTGASAMGGMFGPLTATNDANVGDKKITFKDCSVINGAVIQDGSFGENYDKLFGAMFADIEVYDNTTVIDNCKVVNTTLKDEATDELFNSVSGNNIIIDGKLYISNGLCKDINVNEYFVSNAAGLETLNAMMADKSAGRDVVVNLTADIDFAGKTWTPVDSHADTAFNLKEINGNGYVLSNLTVNGQAMFTRFAGSGDVTIKDITFDGASINSNGKINTSILTVQTYQNVLLDNVDVKNSTISGGYKVAPLIATVYNESDSTITATLKNCDIEKVEVKATSYDFCTTGMVAFVYADDNDKIEFENCTVTDVKIIAPDDSYDAHAAIYTTDSETLVNEAEGVTVTNVTFEALN